MMKSPHFFLILGISLLNAWADDAVVSKKGIGSGKGNGSISDAEKRLESLNVGWHYNWMPKWQGKSIKGAPYVPMIFANNQWAPAALIDLQVVKSKAVDNPLLGFNEPDGKEQGNMSVQEALEFWPELEKTNRRLGSPATVHADNEWMKFFMEGAEKKSYRVDFICVHWYGPRDPLKFFQWLDGIHKLYDKPIWITEFAIADWSAQSRKDNKHKPREVLAFMKKVLPKLEKLDYVERYAWFPAGPDHPKLGPSALFDAEGNLTELGEFYASFK